MDELTARKDGCAGRLTLHRPARLNAISRGMCETAQAALDAWRDDTDVAIILVDADGPRAFSAGGDLSTLHGIAAAGDLTPAFDFWRTEYRLDATFFTYPKPVISFLHGYVLGAAVGWGCHASTRIVGETARVGMPECTIGFLPDAGGTLLLAQAPNRIGVWMGLTGAHVGPADAIAAGFADTFVPEARWGELKSELARTGNWKRIADAAEKPPAGTPGLGELSARHFSAPSVPAILASLAQDRSAFAAHARAAMTANSPLSMAATLEAIRRLEGSNTVRAALELEYRYAARSFDQTDFLEGIRARILDKDNAPRWRHASPGDVAAAEVDALFAPLGTGVPPLVF